MGQHQTPANLRQEQSQIPAFQFKLHSNSNTIMPLHIKTVSYEKKIFPYETESVWDIKQVFQQFPQLPQSRA